MRPGVDPRSPERWASVWLGLAFVWQCAFAVLCLVVLCWPPSARAACLWSVYDTDAQGPLLAEQLLPDGVGWVGYCDLKAADLVPFGLVMSSCGPAGGDAGSLTGSYVVPGFSVRYVVAASAACLASGGGGGGTPPPSPGASAVESFEGDALANVVAVASLVVVFLLAYIGGRLR